jgi:hypothetical protein
MISYTCDRCGAAIPSDGHAAHYQYVATTGTHRHDRPIDLCPTCDRHFREWLATPGWSPLPAPSCGHHR